METSFLKILMRLFSRRDKKVILVLLATSIIVSIVETIGVSAIMVFVSVATNFGMITKSRHFGALYKFLGCTKHADFIMILGIGLLFFYAFRMMLNAVHAYYMSKFAYMRQQYFATRMFKKFLLFRYRDFVDTNPGTIHQIILAFTGNVTQIIAAMLTIFAEFFTVFCIYAMLFWVNWKMTLVLTALLAVKVYIIAKLFSGKIRAAGKQTQKYSLLLGRTWNESYGNYKFLKLLADERQVYNKFEHASTELAKAGTVNAVWQLLPRYVLETIGFSILISVILYVIYMYQDASFVIPIVSMYAVAFYRFLPSVNKIMMAYNQIQFNKHGPRPIYDFLQHNFEELGMGQVHFNKSITVNNISFEYSTKSKVLKNASLVIPKGQRIGFVGESGAGKSTLADILMGLLTPLTGEIYIDGVKLCQDNVRSWRRHIGYIPQSIYLFDGTVADNVTCGRMFDEQRVITALKKARIFDFLQTKEGIHTLVGEGGMKLSGGQKQRVAIARALYSNPEVLVLDEATSALDNQTEEGIMNEVYTVSSDKTLLVIAHRLSTIERCDKVYKVEDEEIKDVTAVYSKVASSPRNQDSLRYQ